MDESIEFILKDNLYPAQVLVYTHNVYNKEKWKKLLDILSRAKDEKGNNIFWFKKYSMLIPIKMTQSGRPNKKTPEYELYIEPWLTSILENGFNKWNEYEKIKLHEENKRLIKHLEKEAKIKAEIKIKFWLEKRIEELEEDKDIMSPNYLDIKRRVLKDLIDSINLS